VPEAALAECVSALVLVSHDLRFLGKLTGCGGKCRRAGICESRCRRSRAQLRPLLRGLPLACQQAVRDCEGEGQVDVGQCQ